MIRMSLVAGLTTLVFALLPAQASADGGCPEAGSGVTVVVDARAAGGGIRVACAPGSPSSPLQMTYFESLGAPATSSHLRQVGNPAPPMPHKPLSRRLEIQVAPMS